ncbi:MAG: hypothetical protein RLY14_818 [Planctomycetota bacterium]|jgi:hypothetical protein
MEQPDDGIGLDPRTDNLNRESNNPTLYNPHRIHPSDRTARKHYRQLWWMIIMLFLVCWAIQKASNPKLYETFFKAVGVPLTPAKGSLPKQ